MRRGLALAHRRPIPVPPIPEVSLGVVTHLSDDAYDKNRLDVIRMCLDTMLAGIGDHTAELMIWDNGSPLNFRNWLRAYYRPHVLIESFNVGPHNALRNLCQLARAPIWCFSEDDILFSCDWLDRQLEILTTYPNVGIVSGSPQRRMFSARGGIDNTVAWAEKNATVTRGKLLPKQWEDDFAVSLGCDPLAMERENTWDDILVEYKGVKAWAHGHHMEMLCYTDRIYPHLFKTETIFNFTKFNIRVGEAGLMQLTTFDRTAIHIGNIIDQTVKDAYAWMTKPHGLPEALNAIRI